MTDRRAFIAVIGGGLLAAPLAAEAQPAGKVWRIGMLWFGSSLEMPGVRKRFDAFQQGLREQGYMEGRNVAFEHRYAGGKFELFSDLAADLVRLKVDVIVTPGNTAATLAAKEATSTIPIVFMAAGDPVALGFVASLARPGGNVTGVSSQVGPEIVGKRLELLKEAVPKLSRVAVLRNPTNPDTRVFSGEAEVAARSLKVQLHIVEVRAPAEFEGAFAAMTKARASAILVQSVVLVVYGLPYLLVPARAQVLTGQAPVPETYFLRVVGIAFIMLAWLEFQVAGDLVRYRGLTLAYAVLPAFFFVTVALQLATTGFAGALWYWWLNLAVTAVFAVAMFVARRGLAVAGGV